MTKRHGSTALGIEPLGGIDVNSLKDVKAQQLANPAVRQAYDAQAPEFALAFELIAARTQAGLTQGKVAARMGKTQSVVARIESGRGTPSMRSVQCFASEVGACAMVGDSSTLYRHLFFVEFLAYVKGVGGYRKAHEMGIAVCLPKRTTPR